jgi:hypothetical protein
LPSKSVSSKPPKLYWRIAHVSSELWGAKLEVDVDVEVVDEVDVGN